MATPIQTEDETKSDLPIPPGTRCLKCHYSLDGINMGHCPECGFVMGEAEVHRWQERIRWMRSFRIRRWYAACFLIPIAYAVGAFVLSDIGTGIFALVMMRITVGGTILISEILGSLGRQHDRAIARRVWVRSAYLIHMPWLVTAGFAVIILLISWIDRLIGSNGMLENSIADIGWLIWVTGSLLSLIAMCVILSEAKPRLALRWSKLQITIIFPVIMVQFIFNAILGILGGVLVFESVLRLTGLSP